MKPDLSTRELYERYVVPTYGRFDLRLARGQGAEIWDESGKRYLDFGAGIAVTSVGHCHPRVVATMQEQIAQLVHTSNLYFTRPQGELAQRLVRLACTPDEPHGKIFFCNSGAEANEALFKLARKFGHDSAPPPPRHATGEWTEPPLARTDMITMLGSFHGRTLAGISATGQDKVKKGFDPLVPGFLHVPYNDGEALREAARRPETIAILIEPVQGEIGIRPADASFLELARQLCDELGLLLFFDEVQCGLGRTGDWCGWRTLAPKAAPDAMSWAKGIAGGFPLGAVWISDRPVQLHDGLTKPLCDLLGPGTHGTTFGGTPLVCAGANEVLAIIEEEGLVENARRTGTYAYQALRALDSSWIAEVRGVGLMLAVQLAEDFLDRVDLPAGKAPCLELVERLHEAGLLTIPSGTHAVRWLPPLNVTPAQIDEAVTILKSVLAALP